MNDVRMLLFIAGLATGFAGILVLMAVAMPEATWPVMVRWYLAGLIALPLFGGMLAGFVWLLVRP